ncbi:hypothetical protein C8Q75DRAFT_728114 [Abortiporus biennis]|nr:hypothetical protein C8Q75DRAFT_728114 [Abortiporus biennis]
MYVPIASELGQRLYRRKGGGKGGGGAKGGGGTSGSKGSSGSSSSSGGVGSSVPVSGSLGGSKSKTATAYGSGGGRTSQIPAGQLFAGRTQGGGTRTEVYGSRAYGSGYPAGYGSSGLRGVGGLGFPFFFWPVVWGTGFGYGAAYLHDSEYGNSDNSDRPGGRMMEAAFVSSQSNSTFHLLSDNTTISSLIASVTSNCTNYHLNVGASSNSPFPFNSSDPNEPRPEQAIQYYRASSVVLTLTGYNDTVALQDNTTQPDIPLPTWTDFTLFDCLNQTIGQAAPLIDSSAASWRIPSAGLLALLWMAYASFIGL